MNPGEARERLRRFRQAYGDHRAREGRGAMAALPELPYVTRGPLAPQWRIRARSFDCFVAKILRRCADQSAPRHLTVVDLGAGDGWLCYRVERLGHHALALDIRTDKVDGLGAAKAYAAHLPSLFNRIAASFEVLPLPDRCADIAVFNASLHYALDLATALSEAARIVVPGGRVAILDSPFYRSSEAGDAMVAEKRRGAPAVFGDLASDLTTLPFAEYLTPERLSTASAGLGVSWRRHRVRYPLAYELRPLIALLRGRRMPSRFDVWEGRVPLREHA